MKQDSFSKMDGALGMSLRGAGLFAIVALWILVTAMVLFRFLPIFSMGWSDEIVELLFAWMVFICSAELCRQRKHFIVDLIPNMIAGTRDGAHPEHRRRFPSQVTAAPNNAFHSDGPRFARPAGERGR